MGAAAIVRTEDVDRLQNHLYEWPNADPRVAPGPTGATREVRTMLGPAVLTGICRALDMPGTVIVWDPRAAAWLEIVRVLGRYQALAAPPRRLRCERTPLRAALLTWATAEGGGREVLADHMADDVLAELERRIALHTHRRSGDAWMAIECRIRQARVDGLAAGAITKECVVYERLVEYQHAAAFERRTARMRDEAAS